MHIKIQYPLRARSQTSARLDWAGSGQPGDGAEHMGYMGKIFK